MFSRSLIALVCALVLAGPAVHADEEKIILTQQDLERIELAKSRFDDLKEYLEQARDIEQAAQQIGWLGEDQGIGDEIEDGLDLIDWVKELLDTGVATAEFLDEVIRWFTALSCLQQATDCMTGNRDAACVRSYAYGMSQLFRMIHEALASEPFDFEQLKISNWDSLAKKFRAKTLQALTQHYVQALEVASDVYGQAAMWGQICKVKSTCEAICADSANRELFDCPELESVNMSQPMCNQLKEILENGAQQQDAEQLLEAERRSQHFLRESDRVMLTTYLTRVKQTMAGQMSNMSAGARSRASRDVTKLDTAAAEFNTQVAAVIAAERELDLARVDELLPGLKASCCRLQQATVTAYAHALYNQGQFLGVLRNAQSLGNCGRHEAYVNDVRGREPLDCLAGQCPD